MPYLRVQTNASLHAEQEEALLSRASSLVSAHLGKDEKYFMGIIEQEQAMIFSGSRAPLAFLQLKALELPADRTSDLSRELCTLIEEQLAISPDRIYIQFQDVARGMWGWNGDVF